MSCITRDFTCGVRPGTEVAHTETPIEYASCPGGSWPIGPVTLTQAPAGCIDVERTDRTVPDGVYTNATVTMKDGFVSNITSGAPVLQAVTPLCSTTSGTTPGEDTTGATVVVNPDAANLSTFAGGQLSTLFYAEGEQGISVTGFGTAADPIVIRGPTLPTVPTISGLTYPLKNGIQVTNGLVKAFVEPLMGVTTDANSGITLTPHATDGTVAISLTPVTTTTTTTTAYAEPVGVTFWANTSAPFTSGTLSVYGKADTTYLIEWKSGNMETGATYGSTVTYSVTTDATGLYSAPYSAAPRPGLYSVTRSITGTNTVVAYVQI